MTRLGRALGGHVTLVALGVLMVFPAAWAVVTSFKPASAIYDLGVRPGDLTTSNYGDALDAFPLVQLLLNTTVFAAGAAFGQVALALSAAYGIARDETRRRGLLLALLVGSVVVPPQALVLPDYLMVSRLGLLDSYLGLVLPQLGTTAIAVYLLYRQIEAFPPALIEAAQLDGAGELDILLRVVLPNLRGVVTAVTTVLFIQTWNEYLWPLLVTDGIDRATVQIGLTIFQSEQGTAWGPLMAASCLAAAPLVIVYVLAQRRIVDTFVHAGLR